MMAARNVVQLVGTAQLPGPMSEEVVTLMVAAKTSAGANKSPAMSFVKIEFTRLYRSQLRVIPSNYTD